MTDYPDPLDQSRELKQISGEYEFEFAHLIKPYANDQHIEVHPNDDMDDGFFAPDPKSYYRYYLAAAKQRLDQQFIQQFLQIVEKSFATVTELRKNTIPHF